MRKFDLEGAEMEFRKKHPNFPLHVSIVSLAISVTIFIVTLLILLS